MVPIQLTYGHESYKEISEFLTKNEHTNYTLSIYNNLEQATMKVLCDFDDMINVIVHVSNIEHEFPTWIGVNELSDSYVVAIDFTKGVFHTPCICEWKENKLIVK